MPCKRYDRQSARNRFSGISPKSEKSSQTNTVEGLLDETPEFSLPSRGVHPGLAAPPVWDDIRRM